MKQLEMGRNRTTGRKNTPKIGRNWMILKETGNNRKKQIETGRNRKKQKEKSENKKRKK